MYVQLNPNMELILKKAISLSSDEQKALVKKYHETHDISYKNLALASIYKFIFACARYYYTKTLIDINEIFNEGIIGASEGIEEFKDDKTNTFLTYIVWHIKKSMLIFLNISYNGVIRMPAARVNASIRNYKKGLPNEKTQYVNKVINLDGEELDIFGTIEQETYSSTEAEDGLDAISIKNKIDSILCNFDKTEQKIFISHSCGYKTLAECHEYFNVSYEKISAIEHKISNVIRSHFSPEIVEQMKM